MTETRSRFPIDVVYVAASALDFRFTRICIASIRHFYPDVPLQLLPGGPLQPRLVDELQRYWSVSVAPMALGDYGWGFVKLEPLFGKAGGRFLVLDSDTVMTGRVLDGWQWGDAQFIVDDESQSDADTKRLYYDWEALPAGNGHEDRPGFVFNTGQWFGTAGVLTREDFGQLVEWKMPRRARGEQFKCGEQGILNYVLNQKARRGEIRVERRTIMRWPGHSLEGLSAETVTSGAAPPVIIHWAGMKQTLMRSMPGRDLLFLFEEEYFRRIDNGSLQRHSGAVRHVLAQWRNKARFAIRRRLSRSAAPGG